MGFSLAPAHIKLYQKIAANLSEDDVRRLKAMVLAQGHLKEASVEKKTTQEILQMLEVDRKIGKGNFGLLVTLLKALGKTELAQEADYVEKASQMEASGFHPSSSLPPLQSSTQTIGPSGGSIRLVEEGVFVLSIPPGSLDVVKIVSVTMSPSYVEMIEKAGLRDSLSYFRAIKFKPDHLQFKIPAHVEVSCTGVSPDDSFLLFGKAPEGAWQDLSEDCSLERSSQQVSFKLQHFSDYILLAIVSTGAVVSVSVLSSVRELLLRCLNGKSFPCSFTPCIGKVSGKKRPLTIVCKEGYNISAPIPKMYRGFGPTRTSEFNIFDEERLTVEVKDVYLVEECKGSFQINRQICKTENGQAMDLIAKTQPCEEFITGHVVITANRFDKPKKVCSLNLISETAEQSPLSSSSRRQNLNQPAEELLATHPGAPGGVAASSDDQSREGVQMKYLDFVKKKVSTDWKNLARWLGFDDPEVNNIAGRNRDDTSSCMDMLEHWKRERGDDATTEVLMEALCNVGLKGVADGLKNKFPELKNANGGSRIRNEGAEAGKESNMNDPKKRISGADEGATGPRCSTSTDMPSETEGRMKQKKTYEAPSDGETPSVAENTAHELEGSHPSQMDPASENTPSFKVFIVHAGEDKDSLARPLARSLEDEGLSRQEIFFDEWSIAHGEEISETITNTIHSESCKVGVIILSEDMITKYWPKREFEEFLKAQKKKLYPIFYGVTPKTIREKYSVTLGRIRGPKLERNLPQEVDELKVAGMASKIHKMIRKG